jgi:dihydroorotase
MDKITITRSDDWHLHLRDGEALKAVLPDTAHRFARAIVMPNLRPPVTNVQLAAEYRQRILDALPAGSNFEPLMTLYLTDNTSVKDVENAKASRFVKAFKLYPLSSRRDDEL